MQLYYVVGEDSVFSAYGSVFRDGYVGLTDVMTFVNGARGSLTDCVVSGNIALESSGAVSVKNGATMTILRTTFRDNSMLISTDWLRQTHTSSE